MLFFALMLVVIVLMNILWSTLRLGITPTPSNTAMRQACSDLLDTVLLNLPTSKEQPHPNNTPVPPTIIIAGSGWGGLAFFLAQRYTGPIICYEAALVPWLCSRALDGLRKLTRQNPSHITFIKKNTIHMATPQNSIVVCYLYPEGTQTLYQHITNSLPQSQRAGQAQPLGLISIAFAVNHVPATVTVHAKDWMKTPIYWYSV